MTVKAFIHTTARRTGPAGRELTLAEGSVVWIKSEKWNAPKGNLVDASILPNGEDDVFKVFWSDLQPIPDEQRNQFANIKCEETESWHAITVGSTMCPGCQHPFGAPAAQEDIDKVNSTLIQRRVVGEAVRKMDAQDEKEANEALKVFSVDRDMLMADPDAVLQQVSSTLMQEMGVVIKDKALFELATSSAVMRQIIEGYLQDIVDDETLDRQLNLVYDRMTAILSARKQARPAPQREAAE